MVWTPVPGWRNRSCSAARRGVGIEDRLAERAGAAVGGRRDQEDAVREDELGLERRGAVRTGHRGSGWRSTWIRGRRVDHALQRRVRSPRAGPCMTASRSHRPSQSGRRFPRASTSRPRPRASGPTPGRAARHPGPAGRCHRPKRPRRSAADRGPGGRTASVPGGRPAEGRDLGGVALGVGGRGRDDRQPGRRRERDVEDGLALAVGRHLQRPEVVLGLARTVGGETALAKTSIRKVVLGCCR